MEKRKPYNLKWLLAVYNLLQVMACCYLIHGVCFLLYNFIIFFLRSFNPIVQLDYEHRRFEAVGILEM